MTEFSVTSVLWAYVTLGFCNSAHVKVLKNIKFLITLKILFELDELVCKNLALPADFPLAQPRLSYLYLNRKTSPPLTLATFTLFKIFP
jgi:hypothetical protein